MVSNIQNDFGQIAGAAAGKFKLMASDCFYFPAECMFEIVEHLTGGRGGQISRAEVKNFKFGEEEVFRIENKKKLVEPCKKQFFAGIRRQFDFQFPTGGNGSEIYHHAKKRFGGFFKNFREFTSPRANSDVCRVIEGFVTAH